jgi:hypothetical protein
LKFSSAAPVAIQGISSIGTKLISEEAYTTGIHAAAKRLTDIGVTMSRVDNPWHSFLCQNCIVGLITMLNTLFENISSKGFIPDYDIKMLCDNIQSIYISSYDAKLNSYNLQAITAPFTGGVWSGITLPLIVRDVCTRRYIGESSQAHAIEELENVIRCLHRSGERAIAHNYLLIHDYFERLSEIAYLVISFIRSNSEQSGLSGSNILLVRSRSLLTTIIKRTLALYAEHQRSKEEGQQCTFSLSPIIAILIYYSRESKLAMFSAEIELFMQELIKLLNKISPVSTSQKYKQQELYRYIKLFGAWIYKYAKHSPLSLLVTKALADKYPREWISFFGPRFGMSRVLRSDMQRYNYPCEWTTDSWFLVPSEYWGHEQRAINEELTQIDALINYHKVINSMRRKLHK